MAEIIGQERTETPAIELEAVGRRFSGGVEALAGIDLAIQPGDFHALTGPSGCGKTTILRLIAGLDQPSSGRVTVRPRRLAYCFQDHRLLPWRTLEANVALPLELNGVPSAERAERARVALERVGLESARDRLPAACSGGMCMRASVARALVDTPDLLLLDEPFGALDEVTREELDDMLLGLWDSDGMTILLVTHSIREATYLARRVSVMGVDPGRIILEQSIHLGVRDQDTRTGAPFNEQVRILQQALEHGAPMNGGGS
ncbi:MAG: ABC transporter ATP-binding protein [Phycisphaerales bacterium]|jgi:NitT/TauT family transport system ATP-binding protein|nr:ABC transporter ATP-binding protein [Phycisphaerales bacterium]